MLCLLIKLIRDYVYYRCLITRLVIIMHLYTEKIYQIKIVRSYHNEISK